MAEVGDLVFVYGTSPTDRLIRWITGGPSHVRLCVGGNAVAEMIPSGFQYGHLSLPVAANGKRDTEARTELIPMHLDEEQQDNCLLFVEAHQHERYSYLACVSQFFNRIGSPLILDLVGHMDCSQFAAAADGIADWGTYTPARLYEYARSHA